MKWLTIEADIERYFKVTGERLGCKVLKFVSPGEAAVPDRLVLFPGGRHEFVECKAPGKKPRPLQVREFELFASLGHPVAVIDSKEKADEYWRSREGWCE